MRFFPLGQRVLVRLRPLPTQTGTILRVPREEAARLADVLAVGPDVRDVRVGQCVLVSALAGQQIEDQILLLENAVLGVLPNGVSGASCPPSSKLSWPSTDLPSSSS